MPNRDSKKCRFKEEYIHDLEEWLALGHTFKSFAGLIGIHDRTLYAWTIKFPLLLEAKRRGFAKAKAEREFRGGANEVIDD